eukprot:scaffold97418_cov29-Tisochrysis_lutea.AAC.5
MISPRPPSAGIACVWSRLGSITPSDVSASMVSSRSPSSAKEAALQHGAGVRRAKGSAVGRQAMQAESRAAADWVLSATIRLELSLHPFYLVPSLPLPPSPLPPSSSASLFLCLSLS